ncbi:MAG: NADH-quinone oxidoreductase subunit L [Burkholderiales bacterium]|nr:NADH-quinone oxidoreductase subunit L [Phycisphaerae bacterium]
MNFVIEHSYLIPLLPLLGALAAGLLGAKVLKHNSHWPIWIGVGASALMAIVLLVGMLTEHHEPGRMMYFMSHWFDWIVAGDEKTGIFNAAAGAFIDPLTAVMLAVVCGIGFLITVFSKGYMHGESGYFRFFAYLGLFISAMTILVMGDNLIMLYLGWEGVGLCSYLLIGYYYEKPAAREAAKKAFIVNRIGDFGFALGILLTFYCFGTVSFFGTGPGSNTGFLEKALHGIANPGTEVYVFWIPFCLMLGAFGKSAQFPLSVWLPDAMEGPTPVSALIHAATMVTAGVYMIVRLGTLFVGNSNAMITIAVIGAFTAIWAATIALRQSDLKKVFAYSTVSQLGFMFVGVAVLAPVAAVFHLITHAFFKALLFLSSGVVMHATGGELDMCKMSGLKRRLPKTRILMLIGCLALSGFPLLSGFWSKDEIVHAAGGKSLVLGAVMLFTSLLTAYYTFRLYFRVFEGPEKIPGGDHHHGLSQGDSESHGPAAQAHHNPEPLSMMLPLAILAIGAVFAGVINLPFAAGVREHALGHFLQQSPSFAMAARVATAKYGTLTDTDKLGLGQEPTSHVVEVAPLVIGGGAALIGIALAFVLHLQNRAKADELAGRFGSVTRVLDAKYWVDEIYQALIVEPARALGRLFWWFDRVIVGGASFMIGVIPQIGGAALKFSTQRGYLQGYAVSMLACLVLILLWMFM